MAQSASSLPAPVARRAATRPPRGPSRLRQRLRGRYHWILLCGLVTAIIGATVGWTTGRSWYRGRGVVQIDPALPTITNPAEERTARQLIDAHMNQQVALVRTGPLLERAIESDLWPHPQTSTAVDDLESTRRQLGARRVPGFPHRIEILFVALSPQTATQATRALLTRFDADYQRQREHQAAQIRAVQAHEHELQTKLTRLRQTRSALRWGQDATSLDRRLTSQTQVLDRARTMLLQTKVALAAAVPPPDRATASPPDANAAAANTFPSAYLNQLSRTDPDLANLLHQRDQAQDQLADLHRRMGDNASAVVAVRSALAQIRRRIEDRIRAGHAVAVNGVAAAFHADSSNRVPHLAPSVGGARGQGVPSTSYAQHPTPDANTPTPPLPLVSLTADELRQREAQLTTLQSTLAAKVGDLRKNQTQLASLESQLSQVHQSLAQTQAHRRRLALQSQIMGQARIVTPAATPTTPAYDSHPLHTLYGGIAGLILGLLLVPALALLDTRMRYPPSDATLGSAAPLYGAVPALAMDDVDDDASDATALAIHEIRALIQIHARTHHAKAFAITSPSPGSGKTSITVGLAASLAMSGTRTLLVDCDLMGHSRLAGDAQRTGSEVRGKGRGARDQGRGTSDNAPPPDTRQNLDQVMLQMGYLDAADPEIFLLSHDARVGVTGLLDGADLAECVIETSVPNLSILPALAASPEHIGRMSGRFIRRLIDQASHSYDMILFDTGTVPGSVEALFVTSEADGVVLVASRGEQQARFDHAVSYLKAVGAKLAGTVFNRADPAEHASARGKKRTRKSSGKTASKNHRAPGPPVRQVTGSGILAAAVQFQAHPLSTANVQANAARLSTREQTSNRRTPPGHTAVSNSESAASSGSPGTPAQPHRTPSPTAHSPTDEISADQISLEDAGDIASILSDDSPASAKPAAPPQRLEPTQRPVDPRAIDEDLELALDELVNHAKAPSRKS